jgi:superfamily II DNA or RNA helicase
VINAKLNLRPYQDILVNNTLQSIAVGNRNILNIACTGAGKTVCFIRLCELLVDTMADDEVVLILSHLSLLTEQTSEKFARFSDIKVGIMQASVLPTLDSRVIISTMQSARDFSKIAELTTIYNKRVKAIIVDESHRRFSSSYTTIFSYFPTAPIIDFTATPYRNKQLATGFYDDVAYQISLQELIDLKFLVPPVLRQIEFNSDTPEKRCAIVLGTYLEFERGKGAICFMRNKDECKLLCDAFTNSDIKARVVTDNVKARERAEIFRQFNSGEIDALISVEVLTAGFDSPRCEVVSMFGTDAPTSYIQRIGRALRPEDSDSVKPHHKKQTARAYVFGDTPTIQSGVFEKQHNMTIKPKKKEECKTTSEIMEWLEDHEQKDSPEYFHIKEAVRVQKIAKKLNMPLIAAMLEDKSIDPIFLGKLAGGMDRCKDSDKVASIELRKELILALRGNTDFYIEDYSNVTENDAKTLYKVATGKDYSRFSANNPHVFKEGMHKGKHVSEVPWAYKSHILKKAPTSDIAKIIRSYHKKT